MKPVQAYLQELDTEKLINTYLSENPINYEESRAAHPDLTVQQIRDAWQSRLRDFIRQLSEMTVCKPEDGKQSILYVCRTVKDGIHEPYFGMVHLDELLGKGTEIEDYAYEFTPQEVIIGFLVAETPLTQHYIYELIADVLNEASFFGFAQEDLAENLQKLKEADEEVRSGKCQLTTLEEMEKEWEEEFGITFDKESEDEAELHRKVTEAGLKYHQHSRQKELTAIREMLRTS